MTTWDERRLRCCHGVREGLDAHSCAKCQEIAARLGYDLSNGKTYIFTQLPDAGSPVTAQPVGDRPPT